MYEYIFTNLNKEGATHRDEYASYFYDQTKQSYKDYLYQEYIVNDKSKNKLAKYLGIDENRLVRHLLEYDLRKSNYRKVDTNDIYHKTPSMVAEEQGRPFVEIYEELVSKGMSLTEITSHLKIRSIGTVQGHIRKHYQSKELKENREKHLFIKGMTATRIKDIAMVFKLELGIDLVEFVKDKYLNENLSTHEIGLLLGVSTKTMSDYIRKNGFSKTKEQARQDAIESGRMNYDEINRKGRNTRLKNLSRSGKQDMLRELIKYHSEELINEFPNIEIVTGYSEYSILTILEVDIPIIIFLNDKVYKIALEYDGDIWHKERKTDDDKYKMLAEKNWQLMRIEETNATSTNLQILENEAKRIIKQIGDIIRSV